MTNNNHEIQNLETIKNEAIHEFNNTQDHVSWYKKHLGKNCILNEFNRKLKDIPEDARKNRAQQIQALKSDLEALYQSLCNKSQETHFDFSSFINKPLGSLHPLTLIKQQIKSIFINQNFTQDFGPDIESTHYNFNALNIPPGHPARSNRDTFYLQKDILLRTHTTNTQARILEKGILPIKSFSYGTVYRRDNDATHTPMFTQLEALIISKGLNVQMLKTFIISIVHQLLPNITDIKFRPSFFPFTYMGAEIDVKLKNSSSWLEILGCGMVHPNILKFHNIDSLEYQGIAFGMGVERLAMLRYDIQDIRDLYEYVV